jgi:hypothetical protein
METRHHISIHVSPNKDRFAVEKDFGDGGRKGRYLCGVASGLKEDAHGEYVSENCIESLSRQAKEGDVLLFPDIHGIKDSEDIGILTHFETQDNGDWYVEFRLYDDSDHVDEDSKQKAHKLWAQVNGLPPYSKPRRKGFSIEGFIPKDSVLEDKKERLGIIDDMVLEGVVIVPQPAYEDSYIHAIYKALNVVPPWKVQRNIQKTLRRSIIQKDAMASFERERYTLDAARDQLLADVLHNGARTEDLRQVFDEYRDLSLELIQKTPTDVSYPVMAMPSTEVYGTPIRKSRSSLLVEIQAQLELLKKKRKV